MRVLDVHDEVHGLIELLPLDDFVYHPHYPRAGGLIGPRDGIYSPRASKPTLARLQIPVSQICEIAEAHFQAFDGVATFRRRWWPGDRQLLGFGPDRFCAVLIEHGADKVVDSVWFLLELSPASVWLASVLEFFRCVSRKWNLLLVDHASDFQCCLSDEESLVAYLEDRAAN
jgi:hypothetical protein